MDKDFKSNDDDQVNVPTEVVFSDLEKRKKSAERGKKISNIVMCILLAVIIFFAGFFSFLLLNRDIWALSWAIKQAEKENYWGYSKEEIINGAGEGFTSGLFDIYSEFLTPLEINDYYDGRAGVSTAFGIYTSAGTLRTANEINGVFVTTIMDNSPAHIQGVEVMSKVVKVGETAFEGNSVSALSNLISSTAFPVRITFKPVIVSANGVLGYGQEVEKTFNESGTNVGDYFGMSFSYASLASFNPITGVFISGVNYGSNAYNAGIRTLDKFYKYKKIDGSEGYFSDLANEEASGLISELIDTGGYAQFNEIYNDNGLLRERLKTFPETTDNYVCLAQSRYSTKYVTYIDYENSSGIEGLITPDSRSGSMELPDDTAYISLSGFQGASAQEFGIAMNAYRQNGKSKLILDLRGNGGGDLEILRKIASYLVLETDKSTLIMTKNFRNGKKQDISTSILFAKNYFTIDKLVVLIDGGTASASEGLLACLIDCYGFTYENNQSKLEIVGRTTYGKDLVQTTYKFPFGDYAVKFTTARYYSPSGNKISDDNYDGEKGINPSIAGSTEVNYLNYPYAYSNDSDIVKAISFL